MGRGGWAQRRGPWEDRPRTGRAALRTSTSPAPFARLSLGCLCATPPPPPPLRTADGQRSVIRNPRGPVLCASPHRTWRWAPSGIHCLGDVRVRAQAREWRRGGSSGPRARRDSGPSLTHRQCVSPGRWDTRGRPFPPEHPNHRAHPEAPNVRHPPPPAARASPCSAPPSRHPPCDCSAGPSPPSSFSSTSMSPGIHVLRGGLGLRTPPPPPAPAAARPRESRSCVFDAEMRHDTVRVGARGAPFNNSALRGVCGGVGGSPPPTPGPTHPPPPPARAVLKGPVFFFFC